MRQRIRDPFDGWPGCRRHGRGCRVPWGYDEDHTDSDRPYTVDELAARADCPHRYAYPDDEAYIAGFKLWLALRHDSRMSPQEADVAWNVRLEHMAEKLKWADRGMLHLLEEFRR